MRNIDLSPDLLPAGSRVLCAVSGGADSMCLLHMLSQRRDVSLTAAHFNHRLRGQESDGDEAFVRDACTRWGIPLTVGREDVGAFAQREGLSTEEAGRILRYAFLEKAAQESDCNLIATAHNVDDNAETMLFSLVRGTGLTGLSGIPPRRGNIVRPLLDFTRSEILAYLDEHNIPHREDSSNRDEAYTRNRLRSQVMPVLRQLNPRAAEHMAHTAAQLSEIDRYLEENARAFLSQAEESPDTVSLPAEALFQAPRALQSRILFQLVDRLGLGRKDLRAVHLEAVLSLSPGGCLDLPHGVTARREYGTFLLTTQKGGPSGFAPFSPQEGENPVPESGWTVILDAPPWPGLMVRPRRTGDTLTLPNGHKRTLKKLFIDQKLPRWERESIPIVADEDGVIAVAGLGPNLSHPRHERVRIIHHKKGEDIHDEHER